MINDTGEKTAPIFSPPFSKPVNQFAGLEKSSIKPAPADSIDD